MDQLFEGLSRIVRDDQIALCTVLVLAIVQLCAVWRVRSRTFAPLKAETDRILKFAGVVRSGRIPESAVPTGDGHLARAWRSANSGSGGPNTDSAAPEEAFEPSRLLPNSYNARLD